jgi:hypothetical protein
MFFVPKEIFLLIDPNNVSLFLTCKIFNESIDIFYKKVNLDVAANPLIITSDVVRNYIVRKTHLASRIPEYYNNIYNLINVKDIPDVRLQNIRHISFSPTFDENIDSINSLPHVTSIIFGDNFDQLVDNLPCGFFNLPKTLTSLTFGQSFNQPVNNLPETLTSLTFGSWFIQPVDNLPKKVTSLTFGTTLTNQSTIFPKD